jgi:hypothetical protein
MMVIRFLLPTVLVGIPTISAADSRLSLPVPWSLVQSHEQLFPSSCIPSGVELLLKLLGSVDPDFVGLQNEWRNRIDGSFADFDGRTLYGIQLRRQFWLPRDDRFPLDRLFTAIDEELDAGRYVIVSLPNGGGGWHIYLIHARGPDGEFLAVSRTYRSRDILLAADVKARIREARGTDILTYQRLSPR